MAFGHQKRHVPAGETRQDNEGKRDRKFGGCVSALPCARDAVRNMRVTAKQRGREQEAGKYLRFVLNLFSGGTILCVES